MGLFFNRKKAQAAEPMPVPQPMPEPQPTQEEAFEVEVINDDPRQYYVADPQRTRELDDGTVCAQVRGTIYHQGEISAIDGETIHVKLKMCVVGGERYHELFTENKMMLGYISQLTLDRYMIQTRGGIDVRIIRPESRNERYDVVIPLTMAGVANAERLEQLDVSFRLDEKWWSGKRVDDRESYGSCRVLVHDNGSKKPQLFVACGSSVLFTVNSRMKPYGDLYERRASMIRQMSVRAYESEYGRMYEVSLRY